ncbi:hypothetical protein CQW23_32952 [Capsicum baccatum]|uniref:Carboxypeptidase A inhibitor-like domain-containing protein n=1 Tax=Capsicum baccatum TaxID=33114 RepID=A0A2G2V393_CAPBA|nr:hypothetical protein CQW23_32952 [Capsicum baccatum]
MILPQFLKPIVKKEKDKNGHHHSGWGFSILNLRFRVNASRDAPVEIAAIEQRLAVVGGLMTCLRRCNVQSDCDDGWVCSDCAPDALGDGSHCDVFTVNGQGYYATKLQAHYNNKLSAV